MIASVDDLLSMWTRTLAYVHA